jgi:hypothetical protein
MYIDWGALVTAVLVPLIVYRLIDLVRFSHALNMRRGLIADEVEFLDQHPEHWNKGSFRRDKAIGSKVAYWWAARPWLTDEDFLSKFGPIADYYKEK